VDDALAQLADESEPDRILLPKLTRKKKRLSKKTSALMNNGLVL